ncbi:hypothetical protein DPMN_066397 [Dreissena polymorpha]|uniref:Uncharacterized protein n=1 Tax=Dreissena polymorpha TaxID=45954 RepID=A0A9D3YXS6_DREPO|nr:hypothetical protein DPMN_066397 [Dreissena polymorpha]
MLLLDPSKFISMLHSHLSPSWVRSTRRNVSVYVVELTQLTLTSPDNSDENGLHEPKI